MQLGLGVLGWSPDVFWKSTYRELARACQGRAILNGGGEAGGGVEPMSRARMNELVERYG